MKAGTHTWHEENQRHLATALARVRATVEGHLARLQGREPPQPAPRETPGAGPPYAIDVLGSIFDLSPFERDLLLLCAGVEFDSSFAPLCAAAQGDARRDYVTFSLALAALPGAHWSALSPEAPLRRWRLLEREEGQGLTSSPLRVDEWVLHYLAGVTSLDQRIAHLLQEQAPPAELPPSQQALAARLKAWWDPAGTSWPIIQLCGGDQAGKEALAARVCVDLGLRLYALAAHDLPQTSAELETLIRLWEREAALRGAALLLRCDEGLSPEQGRAALALAERLQGMLIVAAREPLAVRRRATRRVDLPPLSALEQRGLWSAALGDLAGGLNGQLDTLVAQFNLSSQGIRGASELLRAGDGQAPEELGAALWEACRAQSRLQLDDLAQRIEPAAGWDDLVLPEQQHHTLRDIVSQVRHRHTVYEAWGFAGKSARGLGISALFAGASGTGKTMAAEVLAQELRLDLYRIDLSSVVSKYIGETEKNLRRIFDAAEMGGAILLFDEADALFGRRSEVKDSHDRYANIEVSYLLQRMEAYNGLAILTTNMKQALDVAFLRRIRFVVQFPFPDSAQRAEIWRQMFPARTPVGALDVAKLARLNIAGGNIRNIALHAAFLAAADGEAVGMGHLLRAARSEYAKLEKPLTDAEVRGWL